MANIRIDLDCEMRDGMEVIFRTPCDCSKVTGLNIFGPHASELYTFKDAHNNDIGDLSDLFASGVLIKVLLDVTNRYAYIMNADTNSYIENKTGSDDEYPGCFCRIIDGEIEWINPPMIDGVEYRTTERINGKPVYRKLVVHELKESCGAEYDSINNIDSIYTMTVQYNTHASRTATVISCNMYNANNNLQVYPFLVKEMINNRSVDKYIGVRSCMVDTIFVDIVNTIIVAGTYHFILYYTYD